MRRIIILTLFLFVACLTARAQLNVQSESAGPERIASGKYSASLLLHIEKAGYVLYIKSSNRFDKQSYFRLGPEIDGAIQTLTDLRGLCDTIEDKALEVESWPGRSCNIIAAERAGWLRLHFDRNAGYCEIGPADLDMFIGALTEKKGQE